MQRNGNLHLPNEIFAKILTHLQSRGSHIDLKNLEKAIDHPELDGHQQTFDHFTYRSQQELTEEGNFICPICLFSQKEIYDDSVWDDLCQKLFGCHFILHGGNELVKTRLKSVRPPSKRKSNGSNEMTRKYLLQFMFSGEVMLGRCRRKSFERTNAYTVSYVKKIHYSKGCDKTLEAISKHHISDLKIFRSVGEFIDHLDQCDSHYYKPTIRTRCDYDEELVNLDFDTLYNSKLQGESIEKLPKPRQVMRKMTSNRSEVMSKIICLNQPDPKLFDAGSQNHDFLEMILWPILTLAISIQLEDHLTYPTTQFKKTPAKNHHALALRDILRCICEVSENLEYNFEINTWMKAKFAAFHGMLEILDSNFPEY